MIQRLLLTFIAVAFASQSAIATVSPAEKAVWTQKLGNQIPTGLEFMDENAQRITLEGNAHGVPTILVLTYYSCPNLCTLILNGLTHTLKALPLKLGKDYRVVSVSIDPEERPELSLMKKRTYLARLGEKQSDGWKFLTGRENVIRALADSVGFGYGLDPVSGEYIHPSGFIVLTPQGRVSQYFFGIQFDEKALVSALKLARQEKRGSLAQEILLYCFHYDPMASAHGPLILKVIRYGSVFSVLAFLALLSRLFRKETLA